MRHAIAFSLIFVASVSGADDKIDVAKGVEQAKAMSKAFFEEDYAKVVDATHPKLVEILGCEVLCFYHHRIAPLAQLTRARRASPLHSLYYTPRANQATPRGSSHATSESGRVSIAFCPPSASCQSPGSSGSLISTASSLALKAQ